MKALEFDRSVVGMSRNLKPYAINLTKDIEAANDLMQETMFRAITNREKFAEGTNLKAWLFTIMKNIFINSYRKKVKQRTIIDTTENLYYINSSVNTTKNKAERSFVMEDIQDAIEKLSPDYKIPFLMHFKGFKYQEIAEELNLPLGTVKSRIFFARKDLKAKLGLYRELTN